MATSAEIQVSWEDYLAVALRRKWFFLVPCLAVFLGGVAYAILSPRIYMAKAVILVQSEKLVNPLMQGLAMPSAVADRLGTLREEILGWSNLLQLISTHHLDANISKDAKNSQLAYEQLVKQLRNDVSVRMKGRSLIQVSYEGRDPAKVQEIVNSLADIVIERDRAIKEKEANTAVGFIEAELSVYRQKLEGSEKKLREFKELYMTQMPVAATLNKQLRSLELTLSTLLISNTQEHPRVIEVKRQIEEVRRQRDAEIQRLVTKGVLTQESPELYQEVLQKLSAPEAAGGDETVQKARETYNSIVEGLESPEVPQAGPQVAITPEGTTTVQINDAAAASLTLSPRQQQELARLTGDQSVNAAIYRGLLEKLERAKITGLLGEDEEGGKFVIIERARYPLKPVEPNVPRTLMIALFFGIVVGIGTVVLAEYLDQAIQTADEAAELLAIPALGSISTITTDADVEAKHRRIKSHFSLTDQWQRFKAHVVNPLWSRVDRALVRWGL